MKKMLAVLFIPLWATFASAGLIFDNGTGNVDDTLVLQLWALDGDGDYILDNTELDTLFYMQAYGGVLIRIDTITSISGIDGSYPGNSFFEHRMRASDGSGNVGAYTWYALAVADGVSHTIALGSYYVNDAGIADLAATEDLVSEADIWGYGTRTITGDEYTPDVNITGAATDALETSDFDSGFFSRMGSEVRDTLLYTYIDVSGPTWTSSIDTLVGLLKTLYEFTDGSGLGVDDAVSGLNNLSMSDIYNQGLAVLRADSADVDTGSGEWWGNSIAAGGAGSGLDSGDSLWLQSEFDDLSISGGGSEACTLSVKNYADSSLIQGARLIVRTLDQTTTKINGLMTDVDGKRIVELDPSDYYLTVSHNNYIMGFDTLTVNQDSSWVFYISQYDPGSPADPGLCRVYGWVYDISGEASEGVEIAAEIPRDYHPVSYDNLIITPFRVTDTTDTGGYWFLDLFPSSVLSNSSTKYLFTVKYPEGVIYRSTISVPDSASWQLNEN